MAGFDGSEDSSGSCFTHCEQLSLLGFQDVPDDLQVTSCVVIEYIVVTHVAEHKSVVDLSMKKKLFNHEFCLSAHQQSAPWLNITNIAGCCAPSKVNYQK